MLYNMSCKMYHNMYGDVFGVHFLVLVLATIGGVGHNCFEFIFVGSAFGLRAVCTVQLSNNESMQHIQLFYMLMTKALLGPGPWTKKVLD